MKNRICIGIVMMLMLISSTGCQQNIGSKNLGDEFVVGQDDQPNFRPGVSAIYAMSEDGIYIDAYGKLEYFDYKSQTIIPLCTKAECDHNNRMTCNAYTCQLAQEMTYYDDYIYYVDMEHSENALQGLGLYRIQKDGTDKEKLYDLYLIDENAANQTGVVTDLAIHRGYIYYDEVGYDKDTSEDISRLCRKKLKKNAEKEIIQEIKGQNAANNMVRGYGNNIYYSTSYTNKEELNRYDIVSGKTEKLMEFNYDNNYSTLTGYTVVNGNLYYKYNDEVIRRDSKTGEETVIFDIAKEKEEDKETADVWWLYGDGEYLYLDNYNDNKKKQLETLLVLNTEGEKIDKLPYGGRFYGADEKYIYFDIPGDDIVAYYDKTQLGKGTFDTRSLLKEDPETGNIIECNEP